MVHEAGRYRQDIQGLRAVAVGAIVIFHAFPAALPGGFVGVDIFFVISGFLITGIIYRDIERGSFSLADFYRKRVRRIFPALFLMLACTLGVGYVLLAPDAYSELGRNTLSSVFFISNVDFWRTSGYFDRAAEFRPLLHTWSLAVEEQFYIVFPVCLLLVMRFARVLVLPLLGAGFLLSLGLSEWSLSDARIGLGAYFLTPFRIYELVLGSMAATAPTPAILHHSKVRFFSVSLGLIMIVAAVTLLSPQVHFPGVTALLPTVGTALILYAGRTGDSPPARLLTSAPFMFIGAISYSLYLWHWPIFAYLRIASQPGHPGPLSILAATALAIGLAALSYRFVEKPASTRSIAVTPFLKLGGLSMAASAVIAGFIWQSGGVPSRFAPATLQLFAAADDISPERKRCHRLRTQTKPYDATCVLGAQDAVPDTVVWGDSHGVELAFALSEILAPAGRSLRQITGSACPPTSGLYVPRRPGCHAINEEILSALTADSTISRVILTMNAVEYFNKDGIAFADVLSGLRETIERLQATGKDVLLIGQIPNQHMDAPGIAGQAAHRGRDPSDIGIPRAEIEQKSARWHTVLKTLAERDGIEFVNLTSDLCGPDICPIVSNGEVLYFNSSHISLTAARRVASALVSNDS